MKGKIDLAARSLSQVRGQPLDSDYIKDELAEIVANHEYEMQIIPQTSYIGSWIACFQGSLRKGNSNLRRTLLGSGMQMMQQLTGKPRRFSLSWDLMLTQKTRYQLHLLLRHHLLPAAWHDPKPILHLPCHYSRQRSVHADFLHCCRETRPSCSS